MGKCQFIATGKTNPGVSGCLASAVVLLLSDWPEQRRAAAGSTLWTIAPKWSPTSTGRANNKASVVLLTPVAPSGNEIKMVSTKRG